MFYGLFSLISWAIVNAFILRCVQLMSENNEAIRVKNTFMTYGDSKVIRPTEVFSYMVRVGAQLIIIIIMRIAYIRKFE